MLGSVRVLLVVSNPLFPKRRVQNGRIGAIFEKYSVFIGFLTFSVNYYIW